MGNAAPGGAPSTDSLYRLGALVADQCPTFRAPIADMRLVQGGRSNLTYLIVDNGGGRYVLRRPPTGAHEGNAHDVLREARILRQLGPADVPLPRVVAESRDVTVLGAPFFVMEFVAGRVLSRPQDAAAAGISTDAERAQRLARNVVAALVAIHAVDLGAVGLDDLRRRGTYVERQLRRFSTACERLPESPARTGLLRMRRNLAEAAPGGEATRLLHGDFKLGNLIVCDTGEVVAVLDWELASTGDPAADLGWLVASWAEPGDGRWVVPPATSGGGLPSRSDIAALYAEAAGQDVAHLDFYVAFAYWRWSAINLGTRQRFLDGIGTAADLDVDALDAQIAWQMSRASELLGR